MIFRKKLFFFFFVIALSFCAGVHASKRQKVDRFEFIPDTLTHVIFQFAADDWHQVFKFRLVSKKSNRVVQNYPCFVEWEDGTPHFMRYALCHGFVFRLYNENNIKRFVNAFSSHKLFSSDLKHRRFYVRMRVNENGYVPFLKKMLKKLHDDNLLASRLKSFGIEHHDSAFSDEGDRLASHFREYIQINKCKQQYDTGKNKTGWCMEVWNKRNVSNPELTMLEGVGGVKKVVLINSTLAQAAQQTAKDLQKNGCIVSDKIRIGGFFFPRSQIDGM